jgi:hypothetical protein
MEDANFTVTLPSNSNMGSHPTNRGNNYVVKLSSPLNFSGQTLNEDAQWEAALTTVQYTNRFYDLRENCTLYFVLEFYAPAGIQSQYGQPVGASEFAAKFTEAHLTAAKLSDLEKRIMRTFLATTHVLKGGATRTVAGYAMGKVTACAGDYKNPLTVVQNITASAAPMCGASRYDAHMGALIDGGTGRLTFRNENGNIALYLFTEQAALVHTLGLPPKAIDTLTPAVYALANAGTKTPRFEAVHSLYVYSDIVKEQRVGDTTAPLLEIVPVKGVPGNRIHYSVNPLTYLPVNRDYMDSINIVIMDEYGNPVVFPDDVENVVCRLRFRRVRNRGLQV